ncbi:MAG: DUF2752 domain-containing protein [bacterium]
MDTAWRKLKIQYLVFVLGFPAALAWVALFPSSVPPLCLFRITSGYDCPGCGMTRGFAALAHLDILSAIRYNPFSPIVFIIAVALWIFAVARLITDGRFNMQLWRRGITDRIFVVILVLYLIYGIGRLALEIHDPSLRLPATISTYGVHQR